MSKGIRIRPINAADFNLKEIISESDTRGVICQEESEGEEGVEDVPLVEGGEVVVLRQLKFHLLD